MQDERSDIEPDEDERAERTILSLLLINESQRPWSVDEVALELDSRVRAEDGIANLRAVGLVHRCGDFVFATRVALYMDRMSL